jgi:hypothetical protein
MELSADVSKVQKARKNGIPIVSEAFYLACIAAGAGVYVPCL